MEGNTNEKFIATLATPFQSLENALQQLLTERSIDTAVGAQLDVIGRLVGQARNGMVDADFRRYCRARISTNRSTGVIEDLITVTDLIVYDDNATIKALGEGTATVRLTIQGVAITTALAEVVFSFAKTTVSAGVRVVVQWSESLPANTFTFDSGPGWDNGHLAGMLG